MISLIKRKKKSLSLFWELKVLNLWKLLHPIARFCFVQSLVEIGPIDLEKKIFKFCQMYFCYFDIIFLLKWAKIEEKNDITIYKRKVMYNVSSTSLSVYCMKVFLIFFLLIWLKALLLDSNKSETLNYIVLFKYFVFFSFEGKKCVMLYSHIKKDYF